MNTRARAEALATALAAVPSTVPTTADDLLAIVRAELGSELALDDFVPHGAHRSRAIAPRSILHVIAGNTPAAGLQTLMRGLLLGSHNLAKLPHEGLPEVEAFLARLPGPLAAKVSCAKKLPDAWLAQADAIVVFGSDATIDEFRNRARPDQLFIPHGHRLSFGVVFDDPEGLSAADAAIDVATFDQLGCLSPQVFYVAPDARTYAAQVASALQNIELAAPRGTVSLSVSQSIRALREEIAFRSANGEACALWQSENSTAWTVIYDEATGFPASPMHRTVYVKPLPPDFAAELAPVRPHLSCAGLFPVTAENAGRIATLGVSRICAIGKMQSPPWTWHQDGSATLAPLVRWVDLEVCGRL